MAAPYIVAIAGGSASGKTTMANRLIEEFGPQLCDVLAQDNYYIDQSSQFDHDGGNVNFDHPDALEFTLMAKHLASAKSQESFPLPHYDFSKHIRKDQTTLFRPKKIIFVDGILILSQQYLLKYFDLMIFVECPESIRFERRLKRDIEQRGRTEQGVREQFEKQVAPMHNLFVEPGKKLAHVVVTVQNFDQSVEEIKSLIHKAIL